ncbi:MAG TPA: 30S ribosomal protein S5 [Patescibacteria group bacterium]|nr:30S ribosomal protein S5 [Patescibacteria group bacterium]
MAEFGNPGRGQNARPGQNSEEKQFDERVVHIDRVARVVKGGRRFRFRALVVVGDHKGKVGIGIAKGADVTQAVTKAVEVAKKHFVTIPIINGTIAHDAEVKIGGARILVKPAAPGTGLIAGGVVRTVLEVTGIHNALSKSLGSTNKINTAYATLEALLSVEHPDKWITKQIQRSKKPAKAKKPTETKA